MTSVAQKTTKRKSETTFEFSSAEIGMPILCQITTSGKRSDFWVERIPSDWGVAVSFRKIWCGRTNDFGTETYFVNLDTVSWVHDCDCAAGVYHGACRHIQASIMLMDSGRLVLPPRPEHVEERV